MYVQFIKVAPVIKPQNAFFVNPSLEYTHVSTHTCTHTLDNTGDAHSNDLLMILIS